MRGERRLKRVKEKLSDIREARKARQNRSPLELVIQKPDAANLQVRDLSNRIEEKAEKLARLRHKATNQHPEVREFFERLYKKQPGTKQLVHFYENQAHHNLLQNGKKQKVDLLEFLRETSRLIDEAMNNNDFLPETSLGTAQPLPETDSQAPLADQIKTEIKHLNRKIAETTPMVVNLLIQNVIRQENVEAQQEKVRKLEAAKEKGNVVDADLTRESKLLESLNRALTDNEFLTNEVRAHINTLEDQRLECQKMLIEELDQATYEATVAELQRIQVAHESQKKSPKLRELKTQVNVQGRVRQYLREDFDKQRQARELVEQKLRSLGQEDPQ